MMRRVLVLLSLVLVTAAAEPSQKTYYAVTYHDHALLEGLKPFTYSYISKGRVQVVELREGVRLSDLPNELSQHLEPIDPGKVLSKTPVSPWKLRLQTMLGLKEADPKIQALLENIDVRSYRGVVENIVAFGRRTTNDSIDWILEQFRNLGYGPTHDYNIYVHKEGTTKPGELVIILGHMDTVANTVGADDNASGAAAVLEAARVLADIPTQRSILFLVTEDEERGLLGAKRYVRELQSSGRIDDVKFVVNMDMIAYNSNGIVDLETKPRFESLAAWMAEQAMLYTSLRPNIVLQAWGSDHVPFIDAGIPALLTIEHWDTHTPCWHRPCDTLDTLNFDYATQIVKLNVAALAIKAEAELD